MEHHSDIFGQYNTYRNESVAFWTIRLWIHNQLNCVDFSKWLENTTQHIFGDIEMQWAHIKPHGAGKVLWR